MTNPPDDRTSAQHRRFTTCQDHVEYVRRVAESLELSFRPRPQPPYGWHLCTGDQELLYGSLDEIETYLRHEKLWDPKGIEHDAWHQIGVAPESLTCDIAGRSRVHGFKRCGGIDSDHRYAVSVWSQLHTIDDVRHKEIGTEFVPITICGRDGVRYRPRSDHTGDQCDLIFPAADGAYLIDVLRLDQRTHTSPVDRILEVAQVMVPLLPDR
ncbi:hypothetical protein ABIA39_000300 [Nocardia sp. GAS34]|uniref:hypothetical protein n=1 Tax=unclassified Nocardia TaxID=2637762 RepID=UPI003D1E0C9C